MVQRQEVLEIHGHLTSFDLVVAPLVDAELLWRLPCSPVLLLEPNGENTACWGAPCEQEAAPLELTAPARVPADAKFVAAQRVPHAHELPTLKLAPSDRLSDHFPSRPVAAHRPPPVNTVAGALQGAG